MNNCETCNHKQHPDGGWCYMFREEPPCKCFHHTDEKVKPLSGKAVRAIMLALIPQVGPTQ